MGHQSEAHILEYDDHNGENVNENLNSKENAKDNLVTIIILKLVFLVKSF